MAGALNTVAAYIFVSLVAVVCAFQVALAAGMPWGQLAMGGIYPGRLPPILRILALGQIVILAIMGCVVLARSGLILEEWQSTSQKLVWGVVAVCGLSALANLATRSRRERNVWAPVAVALLICSIIVALG